MSARPSSGEEKVKLDWQAPRENRPKQQVKLVLNMMLIAMAGIPRGGTVIVSADGDAFIVRAQGDRASSGSDRRGHRRDGTNSADSMRAWCSPTTRGCWRSRRTETVDEHGWRRRCRARRPDRGQAPLRAC